MEPTVTYRKPRAMARTFLFLTMGFVASAQSAITMVQSGAESRLQGQSLRIACTCSGFSVDGFWMSWLRQFPQGGIEWLANFGSKASGGVLAESIKGRFEAPKDLEANVYYLQMNRLNPGDTAVYYCTRGHYYNSEYGAFDYWGQGTMVTVTSEPISAPTVFPLIPCCASLLSQDLVTLGCLMTGYMPDPVDVTWNSGAITAGVKTPPSVYSSGRGFYLRSSQITVPAADAVNSTYLCSVYHQHTGQKQNRTVTVSPCTPPSVKVLVSTSCDAPLLFSNVRASSDANSTMELVCLMSDFFPGYLQVQWLANGKPTTQPGSAPSPVRGPDGRFGASSHLTVRQGEWNQGTLYTCLATHPASDTNSMFNISKCTEPCPSHMGVFLLPPSFEDLHLKKTAHITCLITNMKTTESFEVIWTREKKAPIKDVTEDPQLHDNGTSSVISRLSVCTEDWESGEKFTCTVKHPDLPSPVKVDIVRRKEGSPLPPVVYVLPPHPEELALLEMVCVTCLVKGFNPKDIFVKWLHKDNEVSTGSYITTEPIRALTGGSYFLYSTLQVEAAAWNEGDSFSCVVGHEALPLYLIQKSIDKFTGKPSSVSVSLVMSDSPGTCY